ncbi:unnamed protein product [Durusdinium trenchii]|uniref:G domain-containing protein n=1 Tax=Durusdinium trenchii TaxID=1381693 RepID=A0ABP0S4S1_9DINO
MELLVMFVGSFSAGKSSLINSITGKTDQCRVGIAPTTDDLTYIPWKGISLVDSPGLDAVAKKGHKEKSLEAARRANVAVVVINARHALGESERPILCELLASKPEVLVALNYWNYVEKEKDQEDCLAYVKDVFQSLMPDVSPVIIPLNATNGRDEALNMLLRGLSYSLVFVCAILHLTCT